MSDSQQPTSAPSRELIQRAARGQAEAQDSWFRLEFPCVYRLCLGFLADAVLAEDFAQDAMLHLLDRLDRWDPQRSYEAWRTTVVLNLCRDGVRKSGARHRAEEKLKLHPEIHSLPDPSDAASGKELCDVITAALVQLPTREREAFVMKDLEHHKTSEIAEAMGITSAAVRSLLTLARRRLRGILGPALNMQASRSTGGSHA